MAQKRTVKKNIKRLQRVKTWQLVILLLLAGFIAATFLRLNNIAMVQRRDAVFAADKAGDKEALQYRLYDLQRYVSNHMNADTGSFYLEETYRQDIQRQYELASNEDNPNGNIYQKAQEVCAPRFASWSMAYVQCTKDELARYPSADELNTDLSLPRSDSYRHSFASPLWSPDFAGFSVLLVLAILAVILARLISLLVLHLILKYHYKEA